MKSTFPCELDIFGLHHHPVIQDEVTWPSFVAAALEACVLSTGWRGKHSEVVRSPLLLWPVSELVRRQRRSLKRAKKQPGQLRPGLCARGPDWSKENTCRMSQEKEHNDKYKKDCVRRKFCSTYEFFFKVNRIHFITVPTDFWREKNKLSSVKMCKLKSLTGDK